MLPKRSRLGRSEDLRLVIRTGRPTRVEGIFIRSRQNNNRQARFAIAIPKDAEKKASGRNQMRRQLFSQLARLQNSLRKDVDVYITVRKELFSLSRSERVDRFTFALQKARLFSQRT